jgi:hypothetical protein
MANEHPLAIVSSNLLFRYSIPLRPLPETWTSAGGGLGDESRLPMFGAFEGQPSFAEVRAAWSSEGLAFDVAVRGKKLKLKCQASRVAESDGVQVWIDTRHTQNVHRASRFCHWFVYLPSNAPGGGERAWGTMLKINRAKEDPRTFQMFKSQAASEVRGDGYRLSFWIPGAALTGWNTDEHRRLGFNLAVVDSELGWQTLASDFRLPIAENPSLWQTLELQPA